MPVKGRLKTLTMATGDQSSKKRFSPRCLQYPTVATVVLKDAPQVRHILIDSICHITQSRTYSSVLEDAHAAPSLPSCRARLWRQG